MPLYEYECEPCGFQVELQRPVDERDVPLPCQCGTPLVRRVSKRTGIILKGGGWAASGYQKK